jgi:hypothetical protein
MPRLRFSLTDLFLSVAFVVLCLTIWTTYRDWCASNFRDEILCGLLHNVVRNGDSLGRVSNVLGVEGVDVDRNEPSLARGLSRVVRTVASSRPSGVRATDEFFHFDFQKIGVVLQFRDGKLINHDPAEYGDATPFALHKVRKTPLYEQLTQLGWQMGWLQGLSALVVAAALFAAIYLARRRGYSRPALKTLIVAPVLICLTIACLLAGVRPYFLSLLIIGFTGLAIWYGLDWVTVAARRLHHR